MGYSHGGKVHTVTTSTTTTTTTLLKDKDGNALKVITEVFNKEKKWDTVQVYDNPDDKSDKHYVPNETEVKVLGKNEFWTHISWTDAKSGDELKGWVGHQNLQEARVKVEK